MNVQLARAVREPVGFSVYAAVVFSLALLPQRSHAEQEEKCTGPICTASSPQGNIHLLHARNAAEWPITTAFRAEGTSNALVEPSSEQLFTLEAHERRKVFRIKASSEDRPWKYRYSYRWQHGRLGAQHDDEHSYLLPYASGTKHQLIQGPGGSYSHRGQQAYDFSMPEGTAVRAARAGVVVSVRSDSAAGGPQERFRDQANFVEILHSDGTVAHYLHLQKDGVLVEAGERVQAGSPIGLSGATGFASRPHLHFEVTSPLDASRSRTHAVNFATSRSLRTRLIENNWYTAVDQQQGS